MCGLEGLQVIPVTHLVREANFQLMKETRKSKSIGVVP